MSSWLRGKCVFQAHNSHKNETRRSTDAKTTSNINSLAIIKSLECLFSSCQLLAYPRYSFGNGSYHNHNTSDVNKTDANWIMDFKCRRMSEQWVKLGKNICSENLMRCALKIRSVDQCETMLKWVCCGRFLLCT